MRPGRRGAFRSEEGERGIVGGKMLGVGGGWETGSAGCSWI